MNRLNIICFGIRNMEDNNMIPFLEIGKAREVSLLS